MEANGEVLEELIKAKENIKRKYIALKQGKADIQSLDKNTEDLHFYQINELLDSYSIDKTYGLKLRPNKTVRLGKKEIKLVGNTIIVDDTTYLLTQGLCG
ncbi:Uncharacterized protein FWK35_00030917 [Aphis craccivora]|uniref:DUF8207 domain-containing protein n=1 Tax=Aphis craccivora TaxID=307492 RepID=A0A6G0VUM1_APHCR|nr:Uncharacterized protein FWK35_00030917 [Aphis craccivora]